MSDDAMAALGASFEHGASAYERLRPEFPDAMFEDLVAVAGVRLDRRVLEIGAGTGRATLPLARRGVRVEVVEPSADMLRVLAGRLEAERLQDLVTLRHAQFEDVAPTEGPFGAVIAAQSFHWADPRTRWHRLASLIGPDGVALMFWNGWELDGRRHDLAAILEVYRRDGGDLDPDIGGHRAQASWAEREIADEPLLRPATATAYQWPWTLPAADYLGLLATTRHWVAPCISTGTRCSCRRDGRRRTDRVRRPRARPRWRCRG